MDFKIFNLENPIFVFRKYCRFLSLLLKTDFRWFLSSLYCTPTNLSFIINPNDLFFSSVISLTLSRGPVNEHDRRATVLWHTTSSSYLSNSICRKSFSINTHLLYSLFRFTIVKKLQRKTTSTSTKRHTKHLHIASYEPVHLYVQSVLITKLQTNCTPTARSISYRYPTGLCPSRYV